MPHRTQAHFLKRRGKVAKQVKWRKARYTDKEPPLEAAENYR